MITRVLLLFILQKTIEASKPQTDHKIQNVAGYTRGLQRDVNAVYEPIRIHFNLDDLNVDRINNVTATGFMQVDSQSDIVTEQDVQALIDNVVLPAKAFFEDTVRVVRVPDALALPSEQYKIACYNSSFETFPGGSTGQPSLPNIDMAITVRAEDIFRGFPHMGICDQDEFGRITYAYIELTKDVFSGLDNPDSIGVWYRIMLHEMAHAFGLLEDVWTYWYDPDTGLPRTTEINFLGECGIRLPNNNTIRLSPEIEGGPVRHYELVTPTVQAVAYNQFNCSSFVPGGRVESFEVYGGGVDEYAGKGCPGSHWDSRWFHTDFMSDGASMLYRFPSILAFAAIEDTGWYEVNYSRLEPSSFGRGASCDFLLEKCIDPTGAVPDYNDQIFCSHDDFAGCTNDNNRIGICTVRNYSRYDHLDEVPLGSQYFNSSLIGTWHGESLDHCPVFQGGSQLLNMNHTLECTDPSGTSILETSLKYYGPGSKCVQSSLTDLYPRCDIVGCPDQGPLSFSMSLCVNLTCNVEAEAVEINMGDGTSVLCDHDGQLIDIPDVPGHTIKCPRLAVICKEHYCPKNCIGRGICDYSLPFPKCQCTDPDDASPYCANSRRFRVGELENLVLKMGNPSPTKEPSSSPTSPKPTRSPSSTGTSEVSNQPSEQGTSISNGPTTTPTTSGQASVRRHCLVAVVETLMFMIVSRL